MKKTTQTLIFAMFTELCLWGMSFAGGLPDTGQTECYNDAAEIACPAPGEGFYGQDARI
jgi:hypothetical protein